MHVMILSKIFTELYSVQNHALITRMKAIVEPNAPAIAERFYAALFAEEETHEFLSPDLVKSHLTASMTVWIQELFALRANQSDIEAYIERQKQVGQIHARIHLPLVFVGFGQHVLNKTIHDCLRRQWTWPEELPECLSLATQIIDASIQAINQAYADDASLHDQTLGSLQLYTAGKFLALDCERSRSSLSEWLSKILMALQRKSLAAVSHLDLQTSDFGLWLNHKASIILAERKEYLALRECAGRIEEIAESLRHTRLEDSPAVEALVDQLQVSVHRANWLLSLLSQEAMDMDSSRDTLTRLFNRRYLDPIMQHEIRHCQKVKGCFTVLLIDIDSFKQINDLHGHQMGDLALKRASQQILDTIRVGDHAFRFGGEEFLVVLVDCPADKGLQVAEKLRLAIAETEFDGNEGGQWRLTVSIGVAAYDGHPDYQPTIQRADTALYQAKQAGRNRCCVHA